MLLIYFNRKLKKGDGQKKRQKLFGKKQLNSYTFV